jgi:hypothetical protein
MGYLRTILEAPRSTYLLTGRTYRITMASKAHHGLVLIPDTFALWIDL